MVRDWDSKSFGLRLLTTLVERGISLNEFSKQCGVDVGSLSRLTKNKSKGIGISTVVAICETLQISIDWAIFGIEPKLLRNRDRPLPAINQPDDAEETTDVKSVPSKKAIQS